MELGVELELDNNDMCVNDNDNKSKKGTDVGYSHWRCQ